MGDKTTAALLLPPPPPPTIVSLTGCQCENMGLISSALTVVASSVAVSTARRHGAVIVNTGAIKTPLLRQATQLFLDAGDTIVAFAEKQGLNINGSGKSGWKR